MTKARIINGRYAIERALQSGPLATTHLARDLEVDKEADTERAERFVVLKELSLQAHVGDTAEALARFKLLEREARILRNLEHPGIPAFVDTFRTESESRVSVWLVQEYREGRNLRDMVADGWHGSAEDIAGILRQVAEILAYLHSRVPPIVHRDVKPANIIVGPDDRVSLVDLGAACTRVLENRTGSTIVGTPGYVPMEQFVGQAVPASDVYALGMVGVHLVTHEEPLDLIREDGTVRYQHLAQLEHPTLLPAIERMVEPSVSKRLRNARAVLDALDGSAVGPGEHQPATGRSKRGAVRRSGAPRGRSFAYAGAAIALLGMLTAGVVILSDRDRVTDTDPNDDELLLDVDTEEDVQQYVVPDPPGERVQPPAAVPAPEPECTVDVQWRRAGQAWKDDGDEPIACSEFTGALEPMIVGPGRIRLLLEETPDGLPEPPMRGWLDADGTNVYTVVDATPTGLNVLGAVGCPEDSSAVAATLDHNRDVHVACLDFTAMAHHVVFHSERGSARVQGSFGLDFDGAFASYNEEPGARHLLAVPKRGPALLVFATYDDEDMLPGSYRVQPLARGAQSFSLIPPQLSEVAEWTLYSQAGRVHALVRAHKKGDEARELHRVAVTAMGTRLLGNLALTRPSGQDVFCHRVTTASDGDHLLLRSPNEYGDRMLEAALTDSHAIPGPDTASASSELCGDGGQMFLKAGAAEARLLFEESAWHQRLACEGSACTLAYMHEEGLIVVPLTVPARRPAAR